MTQTTIYFANELQVALFKNELSGQISDGYWENSRPFDHWKRICNAEIAIDSQNPRVEISSCKYFIRKYNFANSDLIDVVGDRMKNIVMLAKAGYDKKIISTFDELADVMFTDNKNEYWVNKLDLFVATFGSREEYDRIVNTNRISTAELKKMLREMSKIVNSGYYR